MAIFPDRVHIHRASKKWKARKAPEPPPCLALLPEKSSFYPKKHPASKPGGVFFWVEVLDYFSISLEMTNFWISLVPSPMVQSLLSR
jgi:hypothetical protein